MLISFPNARPVGYTVGVFDWETNYFNWLEIPFTDKKIVGATGIACGKDKIYVLLQHPESETSLLILNSDGTSNILVLKMIEDGHSLIQYDNYLLAVDTVKNRIVKIMVNQKDLVAVENVYWEYSDHNTDEFHINSIEEFNNEIFVSMFGEKVDGSWANSNKGRIVNIMTKETVGENLFHPHTLKKYNEKLIFCESRTGLLREINENMLGNNTKISGYIRGISYDENSNLYIGSSARRRKSKSTGVMNSPEVASEENHDQTNSYIYKLNSDGSAYSILEEKCFSQFGSEIYDIQIVYDVNFKFSMSKGDPLLKRLRTIEDNLSNTEVQSSKTERQLYAFISAVRKMIDKNKYDETIEVLSHFIDSYNDNPEVHYLLAFCYHHLLKFEFALNHYNKALELGFSEYWVRYNRASLYLELGLAAEASLDATRCLEIIPVGIDKDEILEYIKYINSKRDIKWGSSPEIVLTSNKIILPHFLIIGTQKGGTTSLYRYLAQHPNVKSAVKKEVHYFDLNYDKGLDWYKSHFPTQLLNGEITGEASPYYMFHPHIPERIKLTMPSTKFIVMLRNPIDRAYSNYKMVQRGTTGVENLSFSDAVRMEHLRVEEEYAKMMNDSSYNSNQIGRYSYLKRGIYVEQLERWFRHFPKNQFLIINSEKFYRETSESYNQVLKFLELPERELPNFEIYNEGKYENDIDQDTLQYLKNYFEPYNQRLFKLIGEVYDWN
jgi:tetratricopeptide (TPR) repeat protein